MYNISRQSIVKQVFSLQNFGSLTQFKHGLKAPEYGDFGFLIILWRVFYANFLKNLQLNEENNSN